MTNSEQPSLRDLDRPADRIRLHVQSDSRPIVLVEGESDKRLLRLLSDDTVTAFPFGSKGPAIEAMREVRGNLKNPTVCVVDRDFDELVNVNDDIPIFPYENADLEGMLANFEDINLLLEEIGSSEKIDQCGGFTAVEKAVLNIAFKLARLRCANYENGWGLAFDRVDVAGKIDYASLSLKTQSYCAALSATSTESPGIASLIDYAEGVLTAERKVTCPRVGSRYFRGRDYLGALGYLLTRRIGSCKKEYTTSENLAAILRMSAKSSAAARKWYEDLMEFLNRQA